MGAGSDWIPALARALLASMLALVLLLPGGCGRLPRTEAPAQSPLAVQKPSGRLQEVAPPAAVQQLQARLAEHTPRVQVVAPRDGASLPDGPVQLQLQVRDWPLVDAGPLGLGAHVVVQVDDQPPRRVTGSGPASDMTTLRLELPALSPGSHRITAYAARPWGEAVKSPGAWDQVRITRVAANPVSVPQPGTPQLIGVSPAELGRSEPVLLDWLLLNAPLQGLRENDGSWRLRVTINGDSFLVDQNVPLWLKGWQSGSNSVVLELVDGRGEPLNPPFNTLVQEVVIAPGQPQPAWLRGQLSDAELAMLLGSATPPEAAPEPPAPPIPDPRPEPGPATEPEAAEPQADEPGDALPAEQPAAIVEPEPAPPAEPVAPEPAPAPTPAPEPSPSPEAGRVAPAAPAGSRLPTSPERRAASTSLAGSARDQVNADGSLLKPRPQGPLAGLRQKLGG